MRCARCDRIYVGEQLARMPDGRLVFGWCPACVAEEGCRPIDVRPARLVPPAGSDSLARRLRRAARARRRRRAARPSRRLAILGISGLMTAWALILAFVAGVRLAYPGDWATKAGARMLLGVSGSVALASLGVWVALIARARGLGIGLKVVRVAAAVVAVGALGSATLGRPTRRDGVVLGASVAVIGASWLAIRAGGPARPRPVSRRRIP